MAKKPKDKAAWEAFKKELMSQVGQGIMILPVLGNAMQAKLDKDGNVVGTLTDDEQTVDCALGRTAAINYVATDLRKGAKGATKARLDILIPLIEAVYENEISPEQLSRTLDNSVAKVAPELANDDDDENSGGMPN